MCWGFWFSKCSQWWTQWWTPALCTVLQTLQRTQTSKERTGTHDVTLPVVPVLSAGMTTLWCSLPWSWQSSCIGCFTFHCITSHCSSIPALVVTAGDAQRMVHQYCNLKFHIEKDKKCSVLPGRTTASLCVQLLGSRFSAGEANPISM